MKPRVSLLLSSLGVLLLLTGCHTSKKVTPKQVQVYHPGKTLTGNNYTRSLIDEAYSWIGTPYKWAGESKSGTDCSGFMMKVFDKALGIKLPRNSRAQADYCTDIEPRDLVVGDLVFFKTNGTGNVSHVGMYVGEGHFIHASSSRGVIVSNLQENYYVAHFHHCGRVDRYAALISRMPMAPAGIVEPPAIPTDVEPDVPAPEAPAVQPVPDEKPQTPVQKKTEKKQISVQSLPEEKPQTPVQGSVQTKPGEKPQTPVQTPSRRAKTARHH